jgi:hypothetical protein
MTRHIDYIHSPKLEPFSPPRFCQSGARLEEYTYYYQKGYHQVTGKPHHHHSASEQKALLRIAA